MSKRRYYGSICWFGGPPKFPPKRRQIVHVLFGDTMFCPYLVEQHIYTYRYDNVWCFGRILFSGCVKRTRKGNHPFKKCPIRQTYKHSTLEVRLLHSQKPDCQQVSHLRFPLQSSQEVISFWRFAFSRVQKGSFGLVCKWFFL